MSRGIRKDTPERIKLAREADPLAIGPWLGEMCTHFNISASMLSSMVGAHEQTVLRWFFGVTNVAPQWLKPVVQLMCVLDWMRSSNQPPLSGTAEEKAHEFGKYVAALGKLAKRTA